MGEVKIIDEGGDKKVRIDGFLLLIQQLWKIHGRTHSVTVQMNMRSQRDCIHLHVIYPKENLTDISLECSVLMWSTDCKIHSTR